MQVRHAELEASGLQGMLVADCWTVSQSHSRSVSFSVTTRRVVQALCGTGCSAGLQVSTGQPDTVVVLAVQYLPKVQVLHSG